MNELNAFFKNTAKVLKNHTVRELNEAVVKFLKAKNTTDKREGVDEVLEAVANNYGISKRVLIKSTARGKVHTARQMAYVILHYDTGLDTRYIANKIFSKWQNSVSIAIQFFKRLDPENELDREFLRTYDKLKHKLYRNPNLGTTTILSTVKNNTK